MSGAQVRVDIGCHLTDHMSDTLRTTFLAAVKKRFGFLAEYGFRFKEESRPLYAEFASDGLEFFVCLDANFGEIQVGFVKPGSTAPSYGLVEFIKVYDPHAGELYRDPRARTEAELDDHLQVLAGLVQKYGQELLRGDLNVLTRIAELRAEYILRASHPSRRGETRGPTDSRRGD